MKAYRILFCLSILSLAAMKTKAQDASPKQLEYRNMALEYSHSLNSARHATAMSIYMEDARKADFLPKLTGSANFKYTGNPMELNTSIPELGIPLSFQGQDMKYGAYLTLYQPVYSGGAISANYRKASLEKETAHLTERLTAEEISYDADILYWNNVALRETRQVISEYKNSMSELVGIVSERVDAGLIDRNELLMAEVRYNDAEYQELKIKSDEEISRYALNSFAGIPYQDTIATDETVHALFETENMDGDDIDKIIFSKPEYRIAGNEILISEQEKKIADSQFLPQIGIGIDGSYSSPGYNFKSDMDLNYAVYANLSFNILEWGKRFMIRNAMDQKTEMARINQEKIYDELKLQIVTAYHAYCRATEKVALTYNSLKKAEESKEIDLEKYKEGEISILEVIDSQLYYQQTQINHIQSKLDAQLARSHYWLLTGK